ncbi:shikimate kinase [Marivivens donghaensis]|uniref:Shikimate kinase n=1 Tax=Marivivens donghaensis TaxID=1699413 RepID=A0ABX0W127_9RHOB|nr:shikimate kinase [Marivivens donghaensis]NIY73390.1 shikimate kinase [Marivivens donghaensis]
MGPRVQESDHDTDNSVAKAEKYRLHRTVVLVGMMGSGKSAIGKALAAKLGVPFVDSDHEIEVAANATIAEIFTRDGEEFFRRRESEVIERLLSGPPCILSTGGGAFMAERNRTAITEKGVSVWLKATLDTLWDRVRHKDTRPLLRTPNPRKTLSELMTKRDPIYALANLSAQTKKGNSIEATTNNVIRSLLSRPDVLEKE